MRFLLLTICLIYSSAYGTPNSPTPSEFQALLKLDYRAFDQNLPDGGWRAILDDVEAGKVLDSYSIQNSENLKPWQARTILWHAGQAYAMANLTDVALARFRKSYDPDVKPNDTFKWNSYVKGSIAFLEQDIKGLIEARDEMRAANPSSPNLKILEAFVRCFKKSYKEAYNPNCEP